MPTNLAARKTAFYTFLNHIWGIDEACNARLNFHYFSTYKYNVLRRSDALTKFYTILNVFRRYFWQLLLSFQFRKKSKDWKQHEGIKYNKNNINNKLIFSIPDEDYNVLW